MPKLFYYSGIITKLRGMQSHLLSMKEYKELSHMNTVRDYILYLKSHGGYSFVLEALNENNVHRGEIEHLLHLTAAYDFSKIYLFATPKQRRLLTVFFHHFEADLLKSIITHIYFKDSSPIQISKFQSLFENYSKIDLKELVKSTTLEQFLEHLEGSIYYAPLKALYETNEATLYDYQSQIDIYYFIHAWNSIQKLKNKREREIYASIVGTQIDLQNIMWAYRMKRFYSMEDSYIYSRMIPVHYKLSDEELQSLIRASSMDEFYTLLEHTAYKQLAVGSDNDDLEKNYLAERSSYLHKKKNQYPLSMASILYYLFQKELEVDHLTTILECIRYQIQPKNMMQYLSFTQASNGMEGSYD